MNEHQAFELAWWGDCANTFGEENKQILYAQLMGLPYGPIFDEKWPAYDLGGRTILDIGGGPASLLLKCRNIGPSAVLDPCPYPDWVAARYEAHGVALFRRPAETADLRDAMFDEAWMYNVLQHVDDPSSVIATARKHAKVIRIADFPYTEPHLGHPQTLIPEQLDELLGGKGIVSTVNTNGINGLVYHGVFG